MSLNPWDSSTADFEWENDSMEQYRLGNIKVLEPGVKLNGVVYVFLGRQVPISNPAPAKVPDTFFFPAAGEGWDERAKAIPLRRDEVLQHIGEVLRTQWRQGYVMFMRVFFCTW